MELDKKTRLNQELTKQMNYSRIDYLKVKELLEQGANAGIILNHERFGYFDYVTFSGAKLDDKEYHNLQMFFLKQFETYFYKNYVLKTAEKLNSSFNNKNKEELLKNLKKFGIEKDEARIADLNLLAEQIYLLNKIMQEEKTGIKMNKSFKLDQDKILQKDRLIENTHMLWVEEEAKIKQPIILTIDKYFPWARVAIEKKPTTFDSTVKKKEYELNLFPLDLKMTNSQFEPSTPINQNSKQINAVENSLGKALQKLTVGKKTSRWKTFCGKVKNFFTFNKSKTAAAKVSQKTFENFPVQWIDKSIHKAKTKDFNLYNNNLQIEHLSLISSSLEKNEKVDNSAIENLKDQQQLAASTIAFV